MTEAVRVESHRPVLPKRALARLRVRLDDRHDRQEATSPADDWSRGVPGRWLTELLAQWRAYDPDALQSRLDGEAHLRVTVDGVGLDVVQTPGRGTDPPALLLVHGWPGSQLEYAELVPALCDPAGHGAQAADAFTVVVVSPPGFPLSDATPPIRAAGRDVAALLHRVMGALGHERYLVHGSDLGAGVAAWLARLHPEAVAGVHLATPGLAVPTDVEPGEAEHRFSAEVATWSAVEGGYLHEQATKPSTLAAGLADSPIGLAAWLGEKYVTWSAARADGSPAFARERMLETLTLYWATDTIASSLSPYLAYRLRPDARLPAGSPPPVPTAISNFGGEGIPFPKPPRELAERYYAVSRFAEHEVGGHFPALAEPELLAAELRAAFASLGAR